MESAIAQQTQKKYLALGDSYTIGESVDEKYRWPVQLLERLRADKKHSGNWDDVRIIATTGWRTDDLMNAIRTANLSPTYDLVSLLIGVNNQYQGKSVQQYEHEFEELLQEAVRLAKGNAKYVFIVSIPDYGFTPFGKAKQQTISAAIDEFNAVNKRIAAKYQIQYFNITDISRRGFEDPSLVASDELHPSGKMYSLWAERIADGLLKDK